MAGLGSRFASAGYMHPKPFIEVLGKPMIEQVLINLRLPNSRFILIAREEHLQEYAGIVQHLQKNYPVEFVTINQVTEGAACTVLFSRAFIQSDEELLIANSDQLIDINIADFIQDARTRCLDGHILTFEDTHPKWSYAQLNAQNLVTQVREKEVISTHATVGIYYFSKGHAFVNHALDMIIRNDRVNQEFYVCPVYNYLIQAGGKVGIYSIDKTQMHGIGTPEDLDFYLNIFKK